jgi:hypothetical protein
MNAKAKGAGTSSPPVTADDVRALLVKHLGAGAPIHAIDVDGTAWCLNHPDAAGVPLSSTPYWHVVQNARGTLRRLHKLFAEQLRRREPGFVGWWNSPEGQSAPLSDDVAEELARIVKERADEERQILADIENLVRHLPCLPRAQDRRSEWHDLALLLARGIEAGYHGAGLTPPTRHSMASPLVLAVRALLKQIGEDHDTDTIRKALGKYPG